MSEGKKGDIAMLKFKLPIAALVCVCGLFLSGCGRERSNLSRAETIKTGMTFQEVYRIMGMPDVGFGLPQKCTEEESWLYYKIPGDQNIVINFVGDIVADPPTSIESRFDLIE